MNITELVVEITPEKKKIHRLGPQIGSTDWVHRLGPQIGSTDWSQINNDYRYMKIIYMHIYIYRGPPPPTSSHTDQAVTMNIT